jgi:3-oxoacyl-[acyl-carrier-protein] synthase-3
MNGPEVFTFTLQAVPDAVRLLLKRSALTGGQVDLYVFHQANRFMLDRLRAKLDIPAERFWIDMENTGNTVSSTIPIALEAARAKGTIRAGDTLMLVGFGLGYSWAATMVRWA